MSNDGVLTSKTNFVFPSESYTPEAVGMLTPFIRKDGTNYTFEIVSDEVGTKVFNTYHTAGFITIEFVAPESTGDWNPVFMASTNELLF